MNVKKQNFFTKSGTKILIQSEWNGDAENIFLKNRNLLNQKFRIYMIRF